VKPTESRSPTKRFFDVLVALCALLVTWPLILIGALLVKATSPGPALYRAKRAGLAGKPFEMLKLRTMRVGLDGADHRVTEPRDARITGIGKLLRKTKVDELPQLWNVLKGEMSIVGPRPEDWEIVQRHFTSEQRRVLRVRPGIASPVDVSWYPDMTYYDPPPPGAPIQESSYTRSALKKLGVTDVRLLGYPDQHLDTITLTEIITPLETVIREVRPRVVFTQYGGDVNRDHGLLFDAVLVATRPMEEFIERSTHSRLRAVRSGRFHGPSSLTPGWTSPPLWRTRSPRWRATSRRCGDTRILAPSKRCNTRRRPMGTSAACARPRSS
jgi:lipopolysaccharide/colanic/teichoic acid biosynthesis glycosyltransferase